MVKDKKTELMEDLMGAVRTVHGVCPECGEETMLVSVVTDYYRCTFCGEDTKQYGEGCLSVPGIYEKVTRPNSFIGKYSDVDGLNHKLEADGLLSVCLQHEIDHLNGRVFVDHLSRLKQEKIIRKLQKEKRKSLAEA